MMRSETVSEWRGLDFPRAGRSGTRSSWDSWPRSAQRLSTDSTWPTLSSTSTSPPVLVSPGLTIAKLAPSGHVVLTDLAPEMLDVATRRANAQGITNFETRVCSADDLPFGDATFDSISVRFGYMFLPDVAKATDEFVRVLKPGGRLCSSVWVKPEENPWTTIIMQAIATEVVVTPPDPDRPNMFRCAAPGSVSDLVRGSGPARRHRVGRRTSN